ncbi:MAG: NADH-quinone oxidoreductase subunit [Actinomycetota bacterium]|jgi:NADH-quinone oxidoreductase subunit N|nr:NADH-quinone oxidoreductase subunit [Actinomycetota bacterium]
MPAFDAPHVELAGIAPELALAVAALFILVFHAIVGDKLPSWYLPGLSTLGLGVSLFLAVGVWGEHELQLGGMVALDGFATFSKVALAVFGLLSVWLARDYLVREEIEEVEFYALVLFAIAGMMLMVDAADLIMMFIALETFSLALYVLVGYKRDSLISQESSMKYFLLGAFSSTFFLLGIALAYGATGTTHLYPGGDPTTGILGFLISNPASDAALLVVATGLLIVGLGFKVAAVPFHMWTPDAYQGAPSPVTGFMAAGSKLAGFAALIRLLDTALFPLRWDWRPLLLGIAVATMLVGSVLAVVQEDVKRLLAYSSIAHAGFVLIGLIPATDLSVSGALFYLATYGITVLGAFAVVSAISERGERRVRLNDYKGLFYENPLMAGALTLFLLSLAGVPLTVGFVGKVVVFGPAIDAGYLWLVVVAMVASAIAAFFYLRVMVVMYMQEPDEGHAPARVGGLATGVIALTAVATIFFGLYWTPLIEAAEKAKFFANL